MQANRPGQKTLVYRVVKQQAKHPELQQLSKMCTARLKSGRRLDRLSQSDKTRLLEQQAVHPDRPQLYGLVLLP